MNKKVFVIDDEPAIGELLSAIFESRGFDVTVAYDGPTGLAKLEMEKPDLLLLDYMLPGMDGIEVLCEVRVRWPQLPVVIITAYGSPELKIKAKKFSVTDVLSKPFDEAQLISVVDRAMATAT